MSQTPTRFGRTNLALASDGATVKNGSGGGAPATDEYSGFPMTGLLLNDRKILWAPANSGFPKSINVDVDLSRAITASMISLHGFRAAAGVTWTRIRVYTQAGAYTPGGTWTSRGDLAAHGDADERVSFTAVPSIESVRLEFNTFSGMFQTGKLYVGDPEYVSASYVADQGSREDTPLQNRTVFSLPSGSTFTFKWGENSRLIRCDFSLIDLTQTNLLRSLADATQPFPVLDADGIVYDCILKDIKVRQIAPGPLFAVSLELLGLP